MVDKSRYGRVAMEDTVTPLIFSKQSSLNAGHNAKDTKVFTIPLTEHDVLNLQAIFVTPGIHVIKMKNVIEGRTIIQTILKSLNYYQNIGCVADDYAVNTTIYDIVGHIKFQKEQRENLLLDLESFFAVYPCFDFIWVEFSHNFLKQCALDDMKKIFNMYHAEERMPVLLIMYEE